MPLVADGQTDRTPSLISRLRSIWRGYLFHIAVVSCAAFARARVQSIRKVPPLGWLNVASAISSDSACHSTLPPLDRKSRNIASAFFAGLPLMM